MKGSGPFSGAWAVGELEAVAADQPGELIEQLACRLHRPLLGEAERAARVAADVVHGHRAAPPAPQPQDFLETREQAPIAAARGQADRQAARLALAQLVDWREL